MESHEAFVRLQQAIEAENLDEMQRVLDAFDQRTGNEFYRLASERVRFRTPEVQGVRYALGRELALKFYGRDHTRHFSEFLKRHRENLVSIRGLTSHTTSLLREAFALNPQDDSATKFYGRDRATQLKVWQ
jgi:hypothetical protein